MDVECRLAYTGRYVPCPHGVRWKRGASRHNASHRPREACESYTGYTIGTRPTCNDTFKVHFTPCTGTTPPESSKALPSPQETNKVTDSKNPHDFREAHFTSIHNRTVPSICQLLCPVRPLVEVGKRWGKIRGTWVKLCTKEVGAGVLSDRVRIPACDTGLPPLCVVP